MSSSNIFMVTCEKVLRDNGRSTNVGRSASSFPVRYKILVPILIWSVHGLIWSVHGVMASRDSDNETSTYEK